MHNFKRLFPMETLRGKSVSILILLLALISATAYADMVDIGLVRNSGYEVNSPQVAADGNGHVYVVWEEKNVNNDYDIYFNYSEDYGFNWKTKQRIDKDTGAGSARYPQIACDSIGHVYVVWEDSRNGSSDIYFNYSANNGQGWGDPDQRLSSVIAHNPKIASDNSGHVYVTWDNNYFNTSANYGATWLTQAIRISTAGGQGTQLTCDQNGHVYVAWLTSAVLFNYSLDYGNTWQTTDRTVSSPGAVPYGPSLASDESGHVYCTWHDGRNNPNSPDIYFNFSFDYGNAWGGSDIRLNTGTQGTTNSIWPEVACDETGHVYVAWNDRRNGLGDIYQNYSSDYGSTWQVSDRRLDTDSPGAVDSGYPEIASNNSGHVYVVWADNQAGIGPGIYVNHSLDYAATYLLTNVKIGSNGFNPRIATDGGRFYIVWENDTPLNDILFNEAASFEVPPFKPSDLSPRDGEINVSTVPTLSWRGGDANLGDTVTYDVYFGRSSPPPLVSSNQTATTYQPGQLAAQTIYYWKIVARDSHGNETSGDVVSFITINHVPDFNPNAFSPANGATDVDGLSVILTWSATDPDPGDTLVYDVYFGTTSPPTLRRSNLTIPNYQPGQLSALTTYYWVVVARDNHGAQKISSIMSFTTLDHAPQVVDYWPPNGSSKINIRPTLTWSFSDADPGDAMTYDIYFGTSSPPPLILSNQKEKSLQLQLLPFTRYYWKIVARDQHSTETSMPIVYFDTSNFAVDHSTANVNKPQITADGNGHVYTVWEDTRNGSSDIYFNYSSDYGATWQASDIRLDTDALGANNSNSPQIACDNNGHVYVVWEDQRSGSSDIYFNYSSDYGATWRSSDKKLSTAPYAPPAQVPRIACDNSGHVYVAWDDNYFNTSADYGATWLTQAIRISTAGGINTQTQLTCDQNGHVYMVWRTSDVLFNYSSDYGITWQTVDRRISNAGAIPYGLSLASDKNGHVYCVWHDGRNNANAPDVYFNSSSDYGNTWGASDVLLNTGTPGTTNSIWPKVACDETGHVYVAWYDKRNGLGDIYLNSSSDYGSTWQVSDRRLDTDSPGASDSGYPVIASDSGGHIYSIWIDNQAGAGLGLYINYSLDYGSTWLSANRKVGYEGVNPQMITDGSRFYMVWDGDDIVFNEAAPLVVPPFVPADPSPSDGTAKVSLKPVLSWRAGDANLDDTVTYDIYLGTTSPPPLVASNQSGTIYIPGSLNFLATYYWQVVAKDGSGAQTAGPIWSFTTASVPPYFTNFSPPDGDTSVGLMPTLSWTAIDPDVGDTLTYDVYFGKTNPPAKQVSNQTSNTYKPGQLIHMTLYYWQVVVRDNHGDQTVGPILSFRTKNNPPQFSTNAFSPACPVGGCPAVNVTQTPTLKWYATDADADTVKYDIYFGTSSSPPLVLSDQTVTSYQPVPPPGKLPHMTTYYWKIVAKDDHGAVTESQVMSFTTLDNLPVFTSFSPAHMAKQISINPTLSWAATDPDPDDTLTYDIYFGTTNPPPLVLSDQTVTSYQPGQLVNTTRYYWKIVAKDSHWDPVTHRGEKSMEVVYFNTISVAPQLSGFSPPNGATGVALEPILKWSCSDPDPGDAVTFDVYFGTTSSPPLKVSKQTLLTYQPGKLLPLTTYYWKIVARDSYGTETIGNTLTFTTSNAPYITYLIPNPCAPAQIVTIYGERFGATQGTSEIHLSTKIYRSGDKKIKSWSNTKIEFEIPPYYAWPPGTTRTKNVWVVVGGVASNKVKLEIRKP